MTVWVVLKSWKYEGDDLVAVTDTLRTAQRWMKARRKHDRKIMMVGWKPKHRYVAKRMFVER